MAWLVDGGSGRRRCNCFQVLGLLSLSLPFSLFRFSFFFFFFCFRFGFSIHFSLSPACFLSLRSPLSPSVSSKKIPPFSLLRSPFIEKQNVAGKLLLVRLQSRLAGRFFRWWWGRGEREVGQFFKNFLFFCYRLEGGKEEEEQCRSKWHRSVFPLFFFLT